MQLRIRFTPAGDRAELFTFQRRERTDELLKFVFEAFRRHITKKEDRGALVENYDLRVTCDGVQWYHWASIDQYNSHDNALVVIDATAPLPESQREVEEDEKEEKKEDQGTAMIDEVEESKAAAHEPAAQDQYAEDEEDVMEPDPEQPFTSSQYAWLPSDFAIDSHGHVAVQSYINGLHPTRHAALYDTVARVFERCVPLLERVLTDLRHPRRNRVQVGQWRDYEGERRWEEEQTDILTAKREREEKEAAGFHSAGRRKRKRWQVYAGDHTKEDIEDDGDEKAEAGDDAVWNGEDGKEEVKEEAEDDRGVEEMKDGEDEAREEVLRTHADEAERVRRLHQPDVHRFHPPPPPSTFVDLRGRTVQVIVRLVTIRLSPSQPSYGGGAWRIKGMRNESIVAAAISYYSQCQRQRWPPAVPQGRRRARPPGGR